MRLLQTLIEEEWPDRAIIFANTKHRCEDIWGHLAADGHRVGLLTGDVAQKNACVSSTTSPKATSISRSPPTSPRAVCTSLPSRTFSTTICLTTAKTTCTASAVPAAQAPAATPSARCEEYALNLPAIETYIDHSIPVSKYNSDALLTDLPAPKRLSRPRGGNGPRRNSAPRRGGAPRSNRKRSS